jgi:hypothetical protein
MITFRSIFDKLVEELKPNKGHMSGVDNFINIADIIDWDSVDADKFKEFLDGSEIAPRIAAVESDPYNIYASVKNGAPEAYYWLLKRSPGKPIKALLKKDGYVLYVYYSYDGGYAKHILVDEANGQVLGMISAEPSSVKRYKEYFGVTPWQVHLSQIIPSMRGGGEGKVMYSMFLEARKAIISDSTLFEGSFAMWDTQIRNLAKYSGVMSDSIGFPLVNKDTSVYDMAIPNDLLDNFFASNTIAPWIIKSSNKLNSLDAKECYYVQIISSKYNEQSFLEVLDSLASEADAKIIVAALKGDVHGKRRGKLDPEVNKFIRLTDEDWDYESWSKPLRLTNTKHIIVTLGTDGRYKPPIAIYDIDLTLPEPEVKIL